jgi:hypothetical protein
MPDVDNSQLVFFSLFTTWAYLRLRDNPSWRRLAWLVLAFAPAAASDWPAFFLAAVLCLHFVLTRPRDQWKWPIYFGVAVTLIFIALLAQVSLAAGDWSVIPTALGRRTGGHVPGGVTFAWSKWLNLARRYNFELHTLPLLLIAALWLLVEGLHVWRKPPNDGATIARLLLVWSLVYVLTARTYVMQHDWVWWPLTPALAIAAGLAFAMLSRWIKRPTLAWSATIVLLIGFSAWSIHRSYAGIFSEESIHGSIPQYTLAELGHAIRAAAPAGEPVVAVTHNHFGEPALWYYADRPLKLDVWDPQTLQQRSDDKTADLPYGYTQVCSGPARRVVLPKAHADWVPELHEYLRIRCRAIDPPPDVAEKFLIFELPK